MSKKFFILLEEFSKRPTNQVGQLCKSISKLVVAKIPVPKAVCIPVETLKIISKANNLDIKSYKLIQETDFKSSVSKKKTISKLKKLIEKQKIPKDLSKEFLKIYHKDLHSSFVSLQNSSPIGHKNILIQNINGDANVIDVFLEVWAKSVGQAFDTISTVDKILFPTPILIKQQIDAEMSGIALTFDESDGNKKRLTIKGVWGIANNNFKKADNYTIDSRTFNLIKKDIKPQASQYIRNFEHLKKQKLSNIKQNQNVLTDKQAIELAKIISKIKKSSLSQLKIGWGLQNSIFFIDSIKETSHIEKDIPAKLKTIKKIYVSIAKNQDSKAVEKHADGLCILNSGNLLSLLGEHPMHVTKSSQRKLLTAAISKTITKYTSIKKGLHLIYRSQNLTSGQLSKLKFSTSYEVTEPNPYLGLRGASKILAQPQIFNLELEIIKNILEKTKNKISLLIPFVRSASEATRVIKLIEKSGLNKNNQFDIWLELSTPESALNISQYPLNKIGGVVFNVKNIHSLVLGIDPTEGDIFSRYSNDTSLITSLIKNVSGSLTKKHKILVDLTNFDMGILKNIISQNVEGIIVNPQVTAVTKKCIINQEEGRII